MGFLLYTESGIFNPVDYGLSPGDTLYVVVVGGGGGGAAAGSSAQAAGTAVGGSGGASSFGNIITAPGGAGGARGNGFGRVGTHKSSIPYFIGMTAGNAGSNAPGSPGAGGWLPDYAHYTGHAGAQYVYHYKSGVTRTFAPGNSLGCPETAVYISSSSGDSVRPNFNVISSNPLWELFLIPNYICTYKPVHDIRAGSGSGYWTANTVIIGSYTGPMSVGGIGYGAGGGSAYASAGAYFPTSGGNSGVIKKVFHQLKSLDSIAITVGGGGSGAASTYTGSSTGVASPGEAGSAGAGGTSQNLSGAISGCGGYGDLVGSSLDATIISNESQASAGGGGAGGCVAIWW